MFVDVEFHYTERSTHMKKMIIGMAIGAAALGATVVPVSAGGAGGVVGGCEDEDGGYAQCNESIWDLLVEDRGDTEDAEDILEQDFGFSDLVLIAGLASTLDACGNGKPQYTLFAPQEDVLTAVVASMDAEVADLAASPDVIKAILADHWVNGSFSPMQLGLSKRLVARSGYILNIQNINTLYVDGSLITADDYYVNGQQIIDANAGCNGYLYTILGFINSQDYVTSEGMNALDTPNDGTPGGTNSLPNTL